MSRPKKIMKVVDHSDEFVDKTLDYLNKSNERLDKEVAYGILKDVWSRVATNTNDIWDNVSLNATVNGTPGRNQSFKLSNGNRVIFVASADDSSSPIKVSQILIDGSSTPKLYSADSLGNFSESNSPKNYESYMAINFFGLLSNVCTISVDDVLYGER